MDDDITKIIKEKFDALPESIQEVILSSNYQDTLIEIGKQHNLNMEQIGILEKETTLVMMGLTLTKDFKVELTRELNIDKIKGFQIVKDINEKVFLKIQELLELMNTPRGQEPSLNDTGSEIKPDWQQNVNFIPSGGDSSAFIKQQSYKNNSEMGEESNIEPKLDERFEKLPLETRNIITQSNYRAILYNIAKEYNLNVEQTGILETFTTNLVTGAIRPDEFENSLKKNIGLPLETVGKLANDINERIFKKIREELVKNTERKKTPLDNEKIDTSILNQAGIEIIPAHKAYTGKESKETLPIPEKLELTTIPTVQKFANEIIHPTKGPERSEESQIASLSNVMHPILTQKLSGPSRIPTTKTEYSLNNITKTTSTPVPQAPKAYPKNADPYRLIPE